MAKAGEYLKVFMAIIAFLMLRCAPDYVDAIASSFDALCELSNTINCSIVRAILLSVVFSSTFTKGLWDCLYGTTVWILSPGDWCIHFDNCSCFHGRMPIEEHLQVLATLNAQTSNLETRLTIQTSTATRLDVKVKEQTNLIQYMENDLNDLRKYKEENKEAHEKRLSMLEKEKSDLEEVVQKLMTEGPKTAVNEIEKKIEHKEVTAGEEAALVEVDRLKVEYNKLRKYSNRKLKEEKDKHQETKKDLEGLQNAERELQEEKTKRQQTQDELAAMTARCNELESGKQLAALDELARDAKIYLGALPQGTTELFPAAQYIRESIAEFEMLVQCAKDREDVIKKKDEKIEEYEDMIARDGPKARELVEIAAHLEEDVKNLKIELDQSKAESHTHEAENQDALRYLMKLEKDARNYEFMLGFSLTGPNIVFRYMCEAGKTVLNLREQIGRADKETNLTVTKLNKANQDVARLETELSAAIQNVAQLKTESESLKVQISAGKSNSTIPSPPASPREFNNEFVQAYEKAKPFVDSINELTRLLSHRPQNAVPQDKLGKYGVTYNPESDPESYECIEGFVQWTLASEPGRAFHKLKQIVNWLQKKQWCEPDYMQRGGRFRDAPPMASQELLAALSRACGLVSTRVLKISLEKK